MEDHDLLETGKAHIEQKEFSLAISRLKEALAKCQDRQQVYFELGKAYYLEGNFPLAVETFKELIKLNCRHVYAHLLLAKSYSAQGELALAREAAKQACGMDTDDSKAAVELCGFFKENRMHELAIAAYERMPRERMENAELLDLIKLYNFQGEFAKAREAAGYLRSCRTLESPFLDNKAQNELEISQGCLRLESRPSILLVTLTNRCNLNCFMCGRGDSVWDVPQVICDQIISLYPFLELVTWQGGEVFLAECFSRLFEKTAGFNDLNQIIITNALLIDESWADRLAGRGNVGLTISIDSVDKKTYEHIRRGASFQSLLANLDTINKARKKHSSKKMVTTLRCTVMKANYSQLDRFIEFARDFEFDVVQMAPLSIDGYDPEDIFVHKDAQILRELSVAMPGIRDLARRCRIKLLDWIPTGTKDEGHPEKEPPQELVQDAAARKMPVCFRPFRQVAMNVKGNFFPECLCAEPIGDVFHNTLEEVWNNEKMQAYRSKLMRNGFTDWCRAECTSGAVPPEHLKRTFA